MQSYDLEKMDLADLKNFQKEVNRAVASFEERKRKEALAVLEAKAKELGFNVADLMGGKAPRARSVSPAKFANPENASDTWTGRGRKPEWFKEAIAAGKSESDLLIK